MELTDGPGHTSRITPLDIHNKEFTKVFRGYSEGEVDEFLDLAVSEFERLIRSNEEMQSKVSGLEARLEHYKGMEETLKNAILLAQKSADQIKEAAAKEASLIKAGAEAEAARIREDALSASRKCYEEAEEQRHRLLSFKVQLKAFLQSALELAEQGPNDILRRLDADREV